MDTSTYAIMQDGLVINIIVADAAFAHSLGAVPLPDGYGIGDSFDGAEWTKAPEPEPEPAPELPPRDVEEVRTHKLLSLNASCKSTIEAGVDYDSEHYSLTTEDQINLMALSSAAVQDGSPKPYHADGKACRIYPAVDIIALAEAATAHITYHTTYCNLLRMYVQTLTDTETIDAVSYGMELPEEYAAIMAEILGGGDE